jgi:hypothetical protein
MLLKVVAMRRFDADVQDFVESPWPALTQRVAANLLGVDILVVRGLCEGKKVESVRVRIPNGHTIFMIRKSAVDDLVKKIGRI